MINQLKEFLGQLTLDIDVDVYAGSAKFIVSSNELRDALGVPANVPTEMVKVKAAGGLKVRSKAGLSGTKIGILPDKTVLAISGSILADNMLWGRVVECSIPELIGGWASRSYLQITNDPIPKPPEPRIRSVGWHVSTGRPIPLDIVTDLATSGNPIPFMTILNNPNLIKAVKDMSPKTIVIARHFPDNGGWSISNPEEWVLKQINNLKPALEAGADYITLTNEWCAHEDEMPQTARVEAAWWMKAMEIAKAKGVKITVLDLSAMHLALSYKRPEIWEIWRPVLLKAAEYGFPVNYHCYTHPTNIYSAEHMASEAMMRWVHWIGKVPGLRIVGGEWGAYKLDEQTNHKNTKVFMDMMRVFDKILARSKIAHAFLGAAAFTLGATDDWDNFDFTNSLAEYIKYMKEP